MTRIWNEESRPVLVVGDPHISAGPWRSRPSIIGDAAFALDQIVAYVREWRTTYTDCPLAVLLVGDVFDSDHPDSEDVIKAVEFVDTLTHPDLGCIVGFIQGQHEKPKRRGCRPWLSLAKGATYLDRSLLRVGGKLAYAMDHVWATNFPKAVSEVPPGVSCLVAHQLWVETTAMRAAASGCLAFLPEGVTQVISGDKHLHFRRRVCLDDKRVIDVLSPGALTMQATAEPDFHALFIVTNDEINSVPIESRPVVRLFVRSQEDLDSACSMAATWQPPDLLPDDLKQPIVIVTIADVVSGARSAITSAWGTVGHIFYRQSTLAELVGDSAPQVAACPEAATPSALIRRAVMSRLCDDPVAANLADALIEADAVPPVLDDHVKQELT